MDPPYVPENNSSFTTYNANGFNEKEHKKLFQLTNNLSCNFVMNNSNTSIIKKPLNRMK